MRDQLRYLSEHGFDPLVVASPGPLLERTADYAAVRAHGVAMQREVAPLRDVVALWQLTRLLRRDRFEVAYVSTPKAGLLAGTAAWLARIPRRVYGLRGLRLETEHGLRRAVLWAAEWVALHVATDVIAESPSLLRRARELHLIGARRGLVLGHGASNGVNTDRFSLDESSLMSGASLRAELGIPSSAFVIGYVGRLVVDKGIRELIEALPAVQGRYPSVWLLVVGAEELSGLPADTRGALRGLSNVRFTGWLDDTVPAYAAMDCLVLPTYREGFPNVPLEAAAMSRPVITTTATGAIDSVIDGETGMLVPPRSAGALSEAMISLVADPDCARSLGAAGRDFVRTKFTNEIVWADLSAFLGRDGTVF